MPTTRFERVIAVLGVATISVLAVLTALAWLDYRDSGSTGPAATPRKSVTRAVSSSPASYQTTRQKTGGRTARQPPRPVRRRSGFVLQAARGDSWVALHADSALGQTLYEGLLVQGKSIRVATRRVWMRLGAPENLDAKASGKPLALPTGTATLFLDRNRLKTLATG